MAKRSLVPHGGNDRVMTPWPLAKAIIDHYKTVGRILDPCRGEGAFYDQFLRKESYHVIRDWCEVAQGRDFLTGPEMTGRHFDWCVSNPPWSQLRDFTMRAMGLADDIVWLCTVNHFWLKARLRDMREQGFAIREIALVDTPPLPWPQSGFQLGAIHVQRGYTGDIKLSRILY